MKYGSLIAFPWSHISCSFGFFGRTSRWLSCFFFAEISAGNTRYWKIGQDREKKVKGYPSSWKEKQNFDKVLGILFLLPKKPFFFNFDKRFKEKPDFRAKIIEKIKKSRSNPGNHRYRYLMENKPRTSKTLARKPKLGLFAPGFDEFLLNIINTRWRFMSRSLLS